MKKITDATYKDIIKIINRVSYKDKSYKKNILRLSKINAGHIHPDGRTFQNSINYTAKVIFAGEYAVKKFPRIEDVDLYLDSHTTLSHISIQGEYEYDKKWGYTDKLQYLIVDFYTKDNKKVFTKKITRGKFEVVKSLKEKVIKDSKNYDQRMRKRIQKQEALENKKAQNIYINV